jgi:hypothetical protein
MSSYAPASSLGWLDLDAAASERVGTLLRSLEEPGTLDALGLGSVRDAFSSLLSPGTSTIQTRLRYFVFLPWIFVRLEEQRVPPAEYARRLRDTEAHLIDCLRHLGPNQGVIGYTAGRELKRLPSEAYWGGLGSWGLRRLDLSLAEYGKRAAALGRLRPDRDDDGNATKRAVSMWATMPKPPPDFLEAELTFDLRPEESQLLVDHIRQRHPGTLLAVMCGQPELVIDTGLPWDLPVAGLPQRLVEVLRHARCFSELTIGPQHTYNVLLARKARDELGWDTSELEARELGHLDDWVTLIGERHEELRAWADNLPGFWAFLAGFDSVSTATQEFVDVMVTRSMTNPAGFVDDPVVHGRIRDREIRLKANRARLAHRSALESWNQTPFGGQLNYRWPITRSYLTDIAAGLAESA